MSRLPLSSSRGTVIHSSIAAPRPGGSDFRILPIAFASGQGIDAYNVDFEVDIPEDRISDWPMVYILANNGEAYIGQTGSIERRMSQHGENPEKSAFTTVNVIYNDEFNHSVLDDYEHKLIEYMHADGRYTLTNKNDGITDYNYFAKAEYDAMFEDLWSDLRELELADHTIGEIEESEVFKYSPFKALNTDQRVALGEIIDAIKMGIDRARPIVVEGMPGTGKTVLATYLLKMLKDNPDYADLNIRLLEPVTALRKTLQSSLKHVSNLSTKDIIGPSDLDKPKYGFRARAKCFDILLVDEAHQLKRRKNIMSYGNFDTVTDDLGLPKDATQLDWILSQAKLPIFFYDPMQVVGPSGIGEDVMRAKLGDEMEHPIRLESQMRVKGGNGYLDYITALLDNGNPKPQEFKGYDFVLHEGFPSFCESFEQTLADNTLTRMIAGYAWRWATNRKSREKYPDLFDIDIGGIKKRWNIKQENWVGLGVNDPEIAHEVGCIHSIQGYDLSYAFVIIGGDLVLDSTTCRLKAVRSDYFDVNGKKTTTEQELTAYIKNIYYVLLTRGIYGTHVYVCDPVLREHLKKFIKTVA